MRRILKLALFIAAVIVAIGIWVSLSRGAKGEVVSLGRWIAEMFWRGWGEVSKRL
ncbi:MAG: hypothetical protein IKS61_01295 [Aeriscardovia sp.]|nr:hypothetical protein [Aeriscardovia sp.]